MNEKEMSHFKEWERKQALKEDLTQEEIDKIVNETNEVQEHNMNEKNNIRERFKKKYIKSGLDNCKDLPFK